MSKHYSKEQIKFDTNSIESRGRRGIIRRTYYIKQWTTGLVM